MTKRDDLLDAADVISSARFVLASAALLFGTRGEPYNTVPGLKRRVLELEQLAERLRQYAGECET
jgi:hypothetical protein